MPPTHVEQQVCDHELIATFPAPDPGPLREAMHGLIVLLKENVQVSHLVEHITYLDPKIGLPILVVLDVNHNMQNICSERGRINSGCKGCDKMQQTPISNITSWG